MMTETDEQIIVKPEVTKPSKVSGSVKSFIKKNLPSISRPVTKINFVNVSPSYWRVNIWGKKLNSTCPFGDNEIIMSKFIRIDLDEDGQYVYNDVTDGKGL